MKAKPPKEIRERREQSRPTPKKRPPQTSRLDWKFWAGVSIGLLGLILSAVGLVLGLRAGPTVSLETPLDSSNVLTTPVEIANNGPLDLTNVRVETYVRNLVTAGGGVVQDVMQINYFPPSKTLVAGESKTVPFGQLVKTDPPTSADVSIILYYHPEYMSFWEKRRVFRFTTAVQRDGTLRLQKQPAENILQRYDALRSLRTQGANPY